MSVDSLTPPPLRSIMQTNRRKFIFVFKLYGVIGLLVGGLSFAGFIISFIPVELSSRQTMLLGLFGGGVSLAILSRSMIDILKERQRLEVEDRKSRWSILEAWNDFENVAEKILMRDGETFEKTSIRSIVSALTNEKAISKRDIQTLEYALQLRNSIAHGKEAPADVVAGMTAELVELTGRLASAVQQGKP